MSASLAGRVLGRSVAVTKCSTPQFLRLRAQGQAFTPTTRAFSASVRGFEKRYTQDHEWVELSADGKSGIPFRTNIQTANSKLIQGFPFFATATTGISTYAAKALGDVVYVELPQIDLEVNSGDSIGAVESVKSASDIMTPVTGKVIEANSILEEQAALINKSPEGEGWLAKLEVGEKGREEVGELMDQGAYHKFTEEADH
ncbi:hypothetical protein MBLNU230_g6522t2 [Neophaeotheca triangularis]